MNYNGKIFKAISNSQNGEVSGEVTFEYKQIENILTCEYSGGQIKKGQLIGIVSENGYIDMNYQQVNKNGEIKTGVCSSRPQVLTNGKVRLFETWQWTSGDKSKGESILEEL